MTLLQCDYSGDPGDTVILPINSRNVCEWAEALASVALR